MVPKQTNVRRPSKRPRTRRSTQRRPRTRTFRSLSGEVVRVIALGGLEEVGRNCTLIEYKNDVIMIDVGLEFPGEEMPGVDYIIPNIGYLKGKEKNVRGVIITHGHLDHIGAVPHIVPKIGNPPVYAPPMAAALIKKRQDDFQGTKINVKAVNVDDELKLGAFKVSFIHINHSIPNSTGVIIETPIGTICHTGDWKFDFHPSGTTTADFQKISRMGENGLLMLMSDSTNASHEGHQISEKVIGEELTRILDKAPGRVIIGTFSSQLSRVKQVVEISESLGRKVALDGYSMKTNVAIARELGFIHVSDKSLIPIEKIRNHPDEKITIMCTGSQGEKNAALSRIAHDEHRSVKIKKGDTIIFSSSIIPGNENSVQRLKDIFYRKGAKVIHKDMMDVHAGGHAKKEDIKLMLALAKPKYFMPIEGCHFLLRENANVAYSMGWDEEHVLVAENGQIIELAKNKQGEGQARLTDKRAPTEHVFVDGLGVGDVSNVILRDRKALADDGVVVVIVQVAQKTGRLVGTPDIVSRGFVHMKENRKLINDTRDLVKKLADNRDRKSQADPDYIRQQIRDEVGKFLFKKTERRPMVLPVILEV